MRRIDKKGEEEKSVTGEGSEERGRKHSDVAIETKTTKMARRFKTHKIKIDEEKESRGSWSQRRERYKKWMENLETSR